MVLFVVGVLSILAMIFLPKKYNSEAMVFVKLGRETVSLDPTATTGNRISVLESRDNEINSIRDMLYSRGIIETVVDRIGPEVILGDAPLTDEVSESSFVSESDFRNSPRQKAIKEIRDNVGVTNARKSSVLALSANAASPELAQRILTEYLGAYQAMHTSAHQTPESNSFFEEQAAILKVQWQESMKALQIAKEDAGVVSIDGAKANLKEQTHQAETQLMGIEVQLKSNLAKLKQFEAFVNKNPLHQQRIGDDHLAAKSAVASLAAEKAELESGLQEMLERAAKLNRDEVTISGLEQEAQLAASKFAQYEEILEQTRIDEAIHSYKFTNVRVVQEPSFIPKPISPKKSIIGVAGLVAGFSGAVLIAILLELLQSPSPPEEEEDGQQVPESDYPDNDEFTVTETIEERSGEIVG